MAIAYDSKSSIQGSGSWNGVISPPSGTAAGKVLLFFIACDGNATGGTCTPPDADWVSLGTAPHPTGDGEYIHGFYRILNSGNLTWSAFTNNIGNEWTGACVCYTGVDTTTPMDATPVTTTNSTMSGSPRSISLTGITTVTANTLLVWAVTIDCNIEASGTITAPTSYTDRENTFSNYGPLCVSDIANAATGATGAQAGTATFASGNAGYGGFLVALRPASSTNYTKSLTGVLSFAGSLTKQTNKPLTGVLSFSGTLTKQTNKVLAGVLSFSGTLTRATVKLISLTATLSFSGSLTKQTNKSLTGVLSFNGALTKMTNRALAGVLSFSGSLAANMIFSRALAGVLSFAGALATLLIPYVPPVAGNRPLLRNRRWDRYP